MRRRGSKHLPGLGRLRAGAWGEVPMQGQRVARAVFSVRQRLKAGHQLGEDGEGWGGTALTQRHCPKPQGRKNL